MKKPATTAPPADWVAYRAWVRKRTANWDPADDRGSATVYVPRFNGIGAEGVERATYDADADD
jgi:hypothetical protein